MRPYPVEFGEVQRGRAHFWDVQSVGQGFADEVFRVFARRYPAIVIKTENANSVVDTMIRHVSAF